MVLSSAMWTQALGVYSVPAAAASLMAGTEKPTSRPPETTAAVLMKSRREVCAMVFIMMS
jgi:hypothetical protein